ncbi:MAG: hypothetical protein ACWGSD_14900, partial [Thermodesulfobacteriota bacterium]
PADKINSLQPDQIAASVILPKEGPLPQRLPVRIELPVDGIRAKSNPEQVGVKALPLKDAEQLGYDLSSGAGTGTNSSKPVD